MPRATQRTVLNPSATTARDTVVISDENRYADEFTTRRSRAVSAWSDSMTRAMADVWVDSSLVS